MRAVGIILICACCTGLGFRQGEYYRLHYRELLYLKKTVMLLRGELRYNCGVIGEVFERVSRRLKEPYRHIFEEFYQELNKGSGERFFDIWDKTVIAGLSETKLWEEDIESFRELGESMGYLDMEMQLNCIDFYIDKLNRRIEDIKEKLDGNIKLFKTLGIMGGILLAILMI